MCKDQNNKKNKNVENVENFREYFNENFETIEMTIKTARDFQFILQRIQHHLNKEKFPDNLYLDGIITIINWIDVSIELHYKELEFLLKSNKY